MNIIELIKDAAFFGGHIPNERLDECRYFFDNVIEKQCIIPVVVTSLKCGECDCNEKYPNLDINILDCKKEI